MARLRAVIFLEMRLLKEEVESLKNRLQELDGDARIYLRDLETLTWRFAGSIESLVRRYLGSLGGLEFESPGTPIDVVSSAHKRGVFQSIGGFADIKDFRSDVWSRSRQLSRS